MGFSLLTAGRGIRTFTVGVAAMVCLYVMVLIAAEPMRTFATSSATGSTVVTLIVGTALTNSCTSAVDISKGGMSGQGPQDTSPIITSTGSTTCTVYTNNPTGYTFGWLIQTGTGVAGSRTGTGHLNGFRSGNRILAFKPSHVNVPEPFTVSANDARWAGRLSSTSTTNTGAGMHWGTDAQGGQNNYWLNVATGATVNIAKRNTATSIGGDSQIVGFRAIFGSSKVVPGDTYKATVYFTATNNP